MGRAALLAAVASSPGAVHTAGQLAGRAADVVTRPVLAVPPALVGLFPAGGLALGTTVVVRGSRAVLLSLLAATTQQSWAAVVGMPDLGMLAAAECGVETGRLALVPQPGGQVADVAAALLDGFVVVALAADQLLDAGQRRVAVARRLSNRARNRAAVLLAYGRWPTADLTLECSSSRWQGPTGGRGYVTGQEITVEASGRGVAGQVQRVRLQLPIVPSIAPAGANDQASNDMAATAGADLRAPQWVGRQRGKPG